MRVGGLALGNRLSETVFTGLELFFKSLKSIFILKLKDKVTVVTSGKKTQNFQDSTLEGRLHLCVKTSTANLTVFFMITSCILLKIMVTDSKHV